MNFQDWASRNAFVSGSGSRNIKTMVGQLDAELQTAGHHCNIFSKEAVLNRRCNDAEMGPANLLHASG